MRDGYEYPTDEQLETIEHWFDDVTDINERVSSFIRNIESLWWTPEWGFVLNDSDEGIILELHTGGWSGNESLISAMEGTLFWALFWQESRRGGHYRFVIKNLKEKSDAASDTTPDPDAGK